MKSIYQIFNSMTVEGADLGESAWSEKEKTECREMLKRSIREKKRKRSFLDHIYSKGVAAAACAVLVLSGTVAAYGIRNYLKDYYMQQKSNVDKKYYDMDFIDEVYDLPVELETETDQGIVDFQVLKADKSDYSVFYTVLITVDRKLLQTPYSMAAFTSALDFTVDITGAGEKDSLKANYWCTNGQEYGLASNQLLYFCNLHFDGRLGTGSIDKITAVYQFSPAAFEECLENYIEEFAETETGDEESNRIWEGGDREFGKELEPAEGVYQWKLNIPIKNTYDEKIYSRGEKLEIDGYLIRFHYISLTSNGIGIETEYIRGNSFAHNYEGVLNRYRDNIYLLMEDGSRLPLDDIWDVGLNVAKQEDIIREKIDFSVPINVSKVISIEIGGQVIGLE
ncbi:MAG: hypothetical protein K2K56_01935 [Lachnospiraceae bacterium]|nr:hypothetical protein [Lachnospiraceae bacterium]